MSVMGLRKLNWVTLLKIRQIYIHNVYVYIETDPDNNELIFYEVLQKVYLNEALE